MSKTKQAARGVAWNWVGMACGMLVTFFLSPYVVHHLGSVAYGVWTIVVSLTSYMALLDMGLRGAVTRFVSSYHTQGDHQSSSRVVSAALWLRYWVAFFICLVSLGGSVTINRFFEIPTSLQGAARSAILITGISLALSLLGGVFGAVLVAFHRFDIISGFTIAQVGLRSAGVVYLLRSGHGILALAVWELLVTIAVNVGLAFACFRIYPELHIFHRSPERPVFRQLFHYSSYVFLIHIFTQITYYTDNLVVGACISVAAVTLYAIGGVLIEAVRTGVASVTTTFMPLASRFEAAGQYQQLRALLKQGTRAALLVALPVQVALFFRGRTFIALWMGSQYAPVASRVLQILLIAQVFLVGNLTAGNIVLGMAKHRRVALWQGLEAIANLSLSVYLARRIGTYGVAVGTLIPSLVVQLLLWPRFIAKLAGVPVRRYLWESWMLPLVATVPFGIACYLTDCYWTALSMFGFFLQIAAILPLYVLGVVVCFQREVQQLLRPAGWLTSAPAVGPAIARPSHTGVSASDS